MTDRESRERLVELIEQAEGLKNNDFPSIGELADHLIANGVFILPEDLRDTEDFSISAFIEAMQMYKEKDQYIKPPCKVGQTVFYVNLHQFDFAFRGKILSYSLDAAHFWFNCHYDDGLNMWHQIEDFGKTVFLTREEAEKVLKEREKV